MNYAQSLTNSMPPSQAVIDLAMSRHEESKRWYAVQTRSNFERKLADELRGRGVEAYLPSLTEVRHWKDRSKAVETPLFRGYLFVHLTGTLDSRWQVLRAGGVVRILGRGADSEPVPDPEIEGIRRLLATRAPLSRHPYLREGVRVRVCRGALRGVEGILLRARNESRLVISVDLLSQSVATEIDADNAEVIGQQ